MLSDLFILRGVPEHIRSDNGPEFVAKAVERLDRFIRTAGGVEGSIKFEQTWYWSREARNRPSGNK